MAYICRCTCTSHKCSSNDAGYTEVSQNTRQQHHRDDFIEGVRKDLGHLSLSLSPTNLQPQTDVIEQDSPVTSSPELILGPESLPDNEQERDVTQALFDKLCIIHDECQLRLGFCDSSMKQLDQDETKEQTVAYERAVMQDDISWLTATMDNLRSFPIGGSEELYNYCNSLVGILERRLGKINEWEIYKYEKASQSALDAQHKTDTEVFRVDNEHRFKAPLILCHPVILLAMLLAVVLSVIADLPDRSCNFLLKMLRVLLSAAIKMYDSGGKFTLQTKMFLKHLHVDIRTVRARFDLEPQITVFAACPKCSALHPPSFESDQNFPVYASDCKYKLFDSECGTHLTKRQIIGKQSVEVPIRPYAYYSFRDFVGELLCRPDIEEMLERCPSPVRPEVLTDIFDGAAIRDFRGPDGKSFFSENGSGSDLHLVWALSTDWFNPFHNKIAGKSVSTGVISMSCLNIELHRRFEINNLFLAAIIPGPQEPSLSQVNHFFEPLIKDLLTSWHDGFFYSRTSKYPHGRRVRSVLLPLVADLPASRKVSGTAGHTSECLCPLCLRKKSNINNLDVLTVPRRTPEEHRSLAVEWRDAGSLSKQKSLAKKNGVRWTALLQLPYWEPRFIAVDTMHNIFLGLVQHHFRVILGIDFVKSSGNQKSNPKHTDIEPNKISLSQKTTRRIIDLLKDNPTIGKLRQFSPKTLYEFHWLERIRLPSKQPNSSSFFTKDELILSLLTCDLVKRDNTPATGHHHLLDSSALPYALLDQINGSSATSSAMLPQTLVTTDQDYAVNKNQRRQALTVEKQQQKEVEPQQQNYIGREEIKAIQQAISSTIRPSWQQAPPKGFGTSRQGKLKADQWRTLIEFDLPITLVELWSENVEDDIQEFNLRSTLLDVTMNLALAIFWGTSHRTSLEHATLYTFYLQKYIQGIQSLSPKSNLVPNHHAALHVGEQLLLFGPVNGWWSFPYERLIGFLQSSNTNYRVGEMELTMQKSFYKNARLRQFLQRIDCPEIVKQCIPIFEKSFPAHSKGSYASNLSASTSKERDEDDFGKYDSGKPCDRTERLENDIYDALCLLETNTLLRKPSRDVRTLRSHIIDGIKFSSRESEHDSIVFYRPDRSSARIPGIVRKIFSTASGVVYFAVHPYLKISPRTIDPFKRWPEFGAGLWSQRIDDQVYILKPKESDICHAARRPWKNDTFVLRALDRKY